MRSSRRLCGLALLLCAASFLVPGVASAQGSGTGSITGKVTDNDGKPLPFANILILGTAWGGMSNDTGAFVIKNVPVGNYSVKVMHMGYEDQALTDVRVDRGETTTISFKIKQKVVGVMDLVEITAARERIKANARTSHEVRGKDAANLPVDDITDLIALKAGVVARGDGLHFRGGRGGEVQFQVDGVPVRDPLVGGGVTLAAHRHRERRADHGRSGRAVRQCAVRGHQLQDQGRWRHLRGGNLYITDDYGQPDNTYDNLDRFTLGIGGPEPDQEPDVLRLGRGDLPGQLSGDQPAPEPDESPELHLRGRPQDQHGAPPGEAGLAARGPRSSPPSMLNERSRVRRYYHIWSRAGYVETFLDTTRTGEVVLRRGRWSPTQVDSHLQSTTMRPSTPRTTTASSSS